MAGECTWCKFARQFHEAKLEEKLVSYIKALPSEMKVDEKEQGRRLEICSGCDGNVDGLCRYCGCFILTRTAKRVLACPHPEGEKWSLSVHSTRRKR